MRKAFLSSTTRDLEACRTAADEAIRGLTGWTCDPMEYWGASDVTPEDQCLRKLTDCVLFVLLVGGCYGSLAPSGKSFTELEYDAAVHLGKPRLVFIHGNLSPSGEPESADFTRQRAFRTRVMRDRVVARFSDASELRGMVTQAIRNWEHEQGALQPWRIRVRRMAPINDSVWRDFDGYVTIGRSKLNALVVQDDQASWEHGVLVFQRGVLVYRHLSRTNPTLVRDRAKRSRLEAGRIEEVELLNQARMTIGGTTFVVEFIAGQDQGYTTTELAPGA